MTPGFSRDREQAPRRRFHRVLKWLHERATLREKNRGRLLKWKDSEGKLHGWTVPLALLIGDPATVRAYLVGNGLPYISTSPGHRNRLTEYLVSAATEQRIRSVGKVGWSGRVFVLPDRALSPDGQEETIYQRNANVAHWGIRGSPRRLAREPGLHVLWHLTIALPRVERLCRAFTRAD